MSIFYIHKATLSPKPIPRGGDGDDDDGGDGGRTLHHHQTPPHHAQGFHTPFGQPPTPMKK